MPRLACFLCVARLACAAWLPAVFMGEAARAEDIWLSKPLVRTVVWDRVDIRSGPSASDDYATGRLLRGETVEVYRIVDRRWVAIRPPRGSFSWIEADAAEPIQGEDRIYRVRRTGTISWIGSAVAAPAQFRWQVRLEQGELVRALGEASRVRHPARPHQVWLRIEPPAGEFRWLPAAAVGLGEAKSGPGSSLASGREPAPRRAPSERGFAQSAEFASRQDAGPAVVPAGFELPRRPKEPVAVRSDWEAVGSEPHRASETFTAERIRLEVAIAEELARDPADWNLVRLEKRLARLQRRAPTTAARRELEPLVRRLKRLADWQERFLEQSDAPTAGPMTAVGANTADFASGDRPDFDAEGWLEPVHSSRDGAQQFALLDDDGGLVAVLVPAPGLRLGRYVKQHVGVFGDRHETGKDRPPRIVVRRVVRRR